jgi:hypothetical protein
VTAKKVTMKTRLAVWDRDKGQCQWGGEFLPEGIGDVQHRRARMSGGSRLPWINSCANLVLVCRPCHMAIEAHPIEAAGRGFRLGIGEHPDMTPLEDWSGFRWRLEVDGSRTALEVAR